MRSICPAHPEEPDAFAGEIVPIRHLFAQGDDTLALYDDHTFLAGLLHRVVHQQAVFVGRRHQAT